MASMSKNGGATKKEPLEIKNIIAENEKLKSTVRYKFEKIEQKG